MKKNPKYQRIYIQLIHKQTKATKKKQTFLSDIAMKTLMTQGDSHTLLNLIMIKL